MKINQIRIYIYDIVNKDGNKIEKNKIISETHIIQIFDNIFTYQISNKEKALSIFISLYMNLGWTCIVCSACSGIYSYI